MTGFETERAAIEGHVQANFTAAPVFFENLPFEPPTGAPYLVLSIRPLRAEVRSIGPAPLRRFQSVVVAEIFVPVESGTAVGRKLTDALSEVLRDRQFQAGGETVLRLGEPRLQFEDRRHGWLRYAVSTPIRRDQI